MLAFGGMGGGINRSFPGFKEGKRLAFLSVGEQHPAPSGIMVGGLSTNYLRNQRLRNRMLHSSDGITSPGAVVLCEDISHGLYCHLLCALAESASIVKLWSLFACEFTHSIT